MRRSVREWIVRILILLAGLVIAHLGVTLFLLSDLGSDPFNVFVQGLFRTLKKLLGGPIIDGFTLLLSPLLGGAGLWLRIAMLVAGCVILAYGMTMVIRSDAGTGPNDLVSQVISEKTGFRFSITRVCVDAAFALLGWLLGGTVGAGTLVCMFLVGTVAGWFLPVNGRLTDRLVRRFCSSE